MLPNPTTQKEKVAKKNNELFNNEFVIVISIISYQSFSSFLRVLHVHCSHCETTNT